MIIVIGFALLILLVIYYCMENTNEIKGDCPSIDITAYQFKVTANLSAIQRDNITVLNRAMDKYGINNKFARLAILAIAGKESGWIPQREMSYSGTPNARLRDIWPIYFKNMSDDKLTTLKADDKAFYEVIYGGKGGNVNYGDAWNFRGGGFNQNTFRNLYVSLSKRTGYDLENHPELMDRPEVAAVCFIEYMKGAFDTIPKTLGIRNMNDFTDQETATVTFFRANAGWSKYIGDTTHQQTLQLCRQYVNYFEY